MGSIEAIFSAAARARSNAYAPYSGFAAGAALRTISGAIFSGANVENAAYAAGTCAEAGAIAAMVVAGQRRIAEIEALVTPCGACRQRIREFAREDARSTLPGPRASARPLTLEALLPEAFGPSIAQAGQP